MYQVHNKAIKRIVLIQSAGSAIRCIVKIANKVELDERTKREAIQIMKDLTKTEKHEGKDPMGIAATIVYLSCLQSNVKLTQRTVAEVAGVTDMTIRNRLKDLTDTLHLV